METSDEELEAVPPSPSQLADLRFSQLQFSQRAVTHPLPVEADNIDLFATSVPGNMENEDNDVESDEVLSIGDTSDVEVIDSDTDEAEVVLDVADMGDTDVQEVEIVSGEVAVIPQNRPPSRPSTPLPPADLPAIDVQSSPEGQEGRVLSPEGQEGRVPSPEAGAQGEELPDLVDEANAPTLDIPSNPPTNQAAVDESPIRTVSRPSPARGVANVRNSQGDFRSPKRRKLMSPAKPPPVAEDEDDCDTCPICFEPWTNSGGHRLAALRCGHLFGQSCIEKWLRGQGGKCPHCNAKAKRLDIRVIYAKTLKTLDTTERDRAIKQAEEERSLRAKAELSTAQARLHYQLAMDECNRLKTELDKCKKQLQNYKSNPHHVAGPSIQSSQSSSGQFKTGRVIKILEEGGCRVLTFSPTHATLIISQPSTSQLFPGFGVKKLSAMDFRTTQFVTVHSKAIRSLCFHPDSNDDVFLSGAMDKTVKLTSLISNTVVQSFNTPMPIWSCVWNSDDKNYFFAGQQNGTVLEFDVRNTQEYVQQMNTEGTRAPVVSLQYVNADQQATFRPGGLLVGQLDRITFYEKKASEHKLHLLPADGSLTSLHFEPKTRHVLTSFRPSATYPTVRHLVSELTCSNISTDPTETETLCSSNNVQTFYGGRSQKVLTRSTLMPCPTDPSRVLACAGNEVSSTVHIWDSSDGQLLQKLPSGGTVVDMCPFEINNQHYLATLTGKSISIHQWL